MSLAEFWHCTPWQFAAAVNGWNKSQGGEDKPDPPSEAEFEAMIEEVGE
jgi:hypothetical protein